MEGIEADTETREGSQPVSTTGGVSWAGLDPRKISMQGAGLDLADMGRGTVRGS